MANEYLTKYHNAVPHMGTIQDCMYHVHSQFGHTFVAKQGGAGSDWTVYTDTPSTGHAVIKILENGDKIGHADAAMMFPEWDKVIAWRG